MGNDETECREAMRYSWLGVEFALIVVAFAAGGYWMDCWLDTLPGFTAVLGVTGVFRAVFCAVRGGVWFFSGLFGHKKAPGKFVRE